MKPKAETNHIPVELVLFAWSIKSTWFVSLIAILHSVPWIEPNQELLFKYFFQWYLCLKTPWSCEVLHQKNTHLCVTRIVYLTSRFHDTMRLVSNGSQMLTSKCGENKKVANEAQLSALLMMLQHSDVFCHLLLDRSTATWTIFLLVFEKETECC